MRIALFGATGYIGARLVPELAGAGHELLLFARPKPGRVDPARPGVTVIPFDAKPGGVWQRSLDGADGVVNLAGSTIGRRWSQAVKRDLVESRIGFTTMLVDAIGRLSTRPAVLVNASGAGIYGDRGDDLLAESEPPGSDFLSRLAADWEGAAARAEGLGVRVVRLRTAVVLGSGGGALERMVLPFTFFAGGPLGSGRQWFPWIHLDDIARIYRHAVESDGLAGPVNAAAGSVRQRELASTIGAILHRPSFLPAPVFALRLVLGEFADALTASQRLLTVKLAKSGFAPRHPELRPALEEILGRP